MSALRAVVRWLLKVLYRVRIDGLEHYRAAGARVLIVANHTSFLDGVLLSVFLPDRLTFAINSRIARRWWVRPFLLFVDFFPLDAANPLALKSLIKYLKQDRKAVIFPEGRITVTGSLMKIYQGPGLVAERSGAMVLPVRIDGPQYTPFSRLRGRVRLRWFPPITLTLLPPRRLQPEAADGQRAREEADRQLADLMVEMMFATSNYRRTVFEGLLDARAIHGGGHVVAEDTARVPVTYRQLVRRVHVLGQQLRRQTEPGEPIGLLLSNGVDSVATVLALQLHGRVPVMLDAAMTEAELSRALDDAGVRRVYAEAGGRTRLAALASPDAARLEVRGAEALWQRPQLGRRWRAALSSGWPRCLRRWVVPQRSADTPALVLFGRAGAGRRRVVVLSHANLLANGAQVLARVDFNSADVVLNSLPLSDPLGLSLGVLVPLLSGMRMFLYPAAQRSRVIPELAYDIGATVLVGDARRLSAYGRAAHPYDFYAMRYVFAGGEALQEPTQRLWADKFGIRLLAVYTARSAGGVLAMNTPMDYRVHTVGRLLPGIRYHVEAVAGHGGGGRLWVQGPNIASDELTGGREARCAAGASRGDANWYDTGDLATVDADGFVTLQGRLGRFADRDGGQPDTVSSSFGRVPRPSTRTEG